jgi:ankyrin repeat protein
MKCSVNFGNIFDILKIARMGLLFDVSENRLDDVRKRLQQNPNDVHLADANGNSALHLAAEKGFTEMVKLLIDNGADLNAANADPPKWSPLHYAAYEGHADVVGLLVASGAIPDVQDSQGDTPESWALDWENFKCAMILGKN